MDKLNIIHVFEDKNKNILKESIFNTMSKSFEINLKSVLLENVQSIVEEDKIHVVLFDNVDYENISLDLTNALKDKFSHIHLVIITPSENEKKQMRIYNKRIDHIWEANFSEDYFRTIFRALLTRMSRKYVISKQLKYQDLTIDTVIREVKIKQHYIDFTPKEYKIFCELFFVVDSFIAKDVLFKKVWRFEEDTTRILDQYLHRIKKKIEMHGFVIDYDKTQGVALRASN